MLPIIASLIANGLPLLANAVMNKGVDMVEEKLGIKIPDVSALGNPENVVELKRIEATRETELTRLALEGQRVDLDGFKAEVEDRANARNKEIELAKLSGPTKPWWVPSFINILTVVVVIGGGYMLMESLDSDIKYAVVAQIATVLAYHVGTTRNSGSKDSTIQKLADRA